MTATTARKQLYKLIDELQKPDSEIILTREGIPVAVLVSFEEMDRWKETVDVLSDWRVVRDMEMAMKEKGGISLEELERKAQNRSFVRRHPKTPGRETIRSIAKLRPATRARSTASSARKSLHRKKTTRRA